MIEVVTQDGVAVVTLRHGKVNALDVELLDALTATVHDLERSAVAGVVLTSSGATFSAGVNLRRVLDEGPAYAKDLVRALSEAFVAWFATPLPVVAAVNGHAIAGGCVLAATADRRVAADVPSALIGASEVRVGVPFPAAALEVLRHACGPAVEAVVLGAGLHSPTAAVELGLLHGLTDPDRLLSDAIATAGALAAGAPAVYGRTKLSLRAPTLARIAAAAPDDLSIAEIWGDPATRERIAAAMPGARAAVPAADLVPDPQEFAKAWAAAWNDRDVESVLAHFAEGITFSSPVAAQVVGGDGVVRGKDALRAYWNLALERVPDLHFEILGTYRGTDSVVIHYRNQKGIEVCEVLHFADGLAVAGYAGYAAGSTDPAGVD
ncbi:MAG TPA: enoyl-CoA hydratase-related protein [Sporichthyaceae bacterium]|nr:enoyl-CoA hydratase-related protein [Sporichthyaceae bacterium]